MHHTSVEWNVHYTDGETVSCLPFIYLFNATALASGAGSTPPPCISFTSLNLSTGVLDRNYMHEDDCLELPPYVNMSHHLPLVRGSGLAAKCLMLALCVERTLHTMCRVQVKAHYSSTTTRECFGSVIDVVFSLYIECFNS